MQHDHLTARTWRGASSDDDSKLWTIATAPPAEYRREAKANLAASTALRAIAAGLSDEDSVRGTMLDEAERLQLLAAMRGERASGPAIVAANAWERPEHAMSEASQRLRRLAAELDAHSGTRAHFLASAERWLMRARLGGGVTVSWEVV
jgi:hypothetical protein